jgi:hypothetical protein
MPLTRVRKPVKDAAEIQKARPIFAKEKPRNGEHEIGSCLTKGTKEPNMEHLIPVAVVAMIALYALIIVGCLKQPEW